MKSVKRLSLFLLILLPVVSFAMGKAEFDALYAKIGKKDFKPVETFLESNRTRLSRDPEYYVLLLNYVLRKGDQSVNMVAKGKPQPGDIALTDPKTGKEVGFIGTRGGYDKKLVLDGITRTQAAIKHFKNRLDIHFGIVAAAEKIERWDIVGKQCEEILAVSRQIDNKWTWGPVNSMSGDPKQFMIQNVLHRTSTLFRLDKPVADVALENVSRAMIKHYPEMIYGYANLGVLYLAKEKYDLAERYFKQALKIDPSDKIVLGNMEVLKKRRANRKAK